MDAGSLLLADIVDTMVAVVGIGVGGKWLLVRDAHCCFGCCGYCCGDGEMGLRGAIPQTQLR